jgi:hypothetical protein
VEVNEYGYRVVLSVENLTRLPVEISARAGAAEHVQVVPPGETVADIMVDSVMGADLYISAGGETRRFPIVHETGR